MNTFIFESPDYLFLLTFSVTHEFKGIFMHYFLLVILMQNCLNFHFNPRRVPVHVFTISAFEMQRLADSDASRVNEGDERERGSEDSRFRARDGRKEPRGTRRGGRPLSFRGAFAKQHAAAVVAFATHAASCRDEARDDLENLACE